MCRLNYTKLNRRLKISCDESNKTKKNWILYPNTHTKLVVKLFDPYAMNVKRGWWWWKIYVQSEAHENIRREITTTTTSTTIWNSSRQAAAAKKTVVFDRRTVWWYHVIITQDCARTLPKSFFVLFPLSLGL